MCGTFLNVYVRIHITDMNPYTLMEKRSAHGIYCNFQKSNDDYVQPKQYHGIVIVHVTNTLRLKKGQIVILYTKNRQLSKELVVQKGIYKGNIFLT